LNMFLCSSSVMFGELTFFFDEEKRGRYHVTEFPCKH
jgi:hypothetical protein